MAVAPLLQEPTRNNLEPLYCRCLCQATRIRSLDLPPLFLNGHMIMQLCARFTYSVILACLAWMGPCSTTKASEINSDLTDFLGLTPKDMRWEPIVDDRDILTVTLVGDPTKPGPLVVRYKIPPNMEIDPHSHREVRGYTVLSGEWKLGFGEVFEAANLQSFPLGSYYRLPPGARHFQKAGPDGATIQVESTGPFTFDLVE